MKKFNFSLQVLLDQCLRNEEAAKHELTKAQALLKEQLVLLEKLSSDIRLTLQQILSIQKKRYQSSDLIYYQKEVENLKAEFNSHTVYFTELRINVENKREGALKAMRQRKILEGLHYRKFAEWNAALMHQEQNNFDEIASMGYNRNKKQS